MTARFGVLAGAALCVGGLLVFIQPLNMRFWGYSGLTAFIALLALLLLPRVGAANTRTLALATLVLPLVVFLLVSDAILDQAYRGTLLALHIVLVSVVTLQPPAFYRSRAATTVWFSLLLPAAALGMIAGWRYVFGHPVPGSENPHGALALLGSYTYLGIGYLPATRNSDVLYFLLGIYAAGGSWATAHPLRRRVAGIALIAFTLLTALTLSRGAVLATAAYLSVLLGVRRIATVLVTGSAVGVLLALGLPYAGDLPIASWLLRQFTAMWLSLVDVDAANSAMTGVYAFSNASRSEIAIQTLRGIVDWPFGFGVDNPLASRLNPASTSTHSESLYLDWLVIFGVFGLPTALAFILVLGRDILRTTASMTARAGSATLLSLAVYASVNSVLDFTLFWVVLSVAVYVLRTATVEFLDRA